MSMSMNVSMSLIVIRVRYECEYGYKFWVQTASTYTRGRSISIFPYFFFWHAEWHRKKVGPEKCYAGSSGANTDIRTFYMEFPLSCATDCEIKNAIRFLFAKKVRPIEIHCQLSAMSGAQNISSSKHSRQRAMNFDGHNLSHV